MQEAVFIASADVDYDLTRLGSYWLIRITDIEYQRPLRNGDRIVVETWGVPIRIPAGLRDDFNQNFTLGSVSL